MLAISNRGNYLTHYNEQLENHPDYILHTLKFAPVKVDLWTINNKLVLGNTPTYEISPQFFYRGPLIIAAHDQETYNHFLQKDYFVLNYFQPQLYTQLTNKKYLWISAENDTSLNNITVSHPLSILSTSLPITKINSPIYGLCSNYHNFSK